jgi:hypothetical protein
VDGNLVLVDPSFNPYWASNTSNLPGHVPPYRLVMQVTVL